MKQLVVAILAVLVFSPYVLAEQEQKAWLIQNTVACKSEDALNSVEKSLFTSQIDDALLDAIIQGRCFHNQERRQVLIKLPLSTVSYDKVRFRFKGEKRHYWAYPVAFEIENISPRQPEIKGSLRDGSLICSSENDLDTFLRYLLSENRDSADLAMLFISRRCVKWSDTRQVLMTPIGFRKVRFRFSGENTYYWAFEAAFDVENELPLDRRRR
ncbi:MAG: hypothetical protein AB9866_05460 [Syntrophobacteraceae bacterium]